jgi:ketosteroid isomerase-like protein
MSQQNVELAHRVFAAWERLDFQELAAFYDREAEFVSPHAEMWGRTYRGHQGLRDYIADYTGSFDRLHWELEEVRDAGEHVVVVGRLFTRGRSSGAGTSSRLAVMLTVRDGVISRHITFQNLTEALHAAGLRTSDID